MSKAKRRQRLQAALEAARKAVCPYPPGPTCDCKKGLVGPQHFGDSSEKTGCPEIRDMIRLLNWDA